jgi:hypothetical protein
VSVSEREPLGLSGIRSEKQTTAEFVSYFNAVVDGLLELKRDGNRSTEHSGRPVISLLRAPERLHLSLWSVSCGCSRKDSGKRRRSSAYNEQGGSRSNVGRQFDTGADYAVDDLLEVPCVEGRCRFWDDLTAACVLADRTRLVTVET